MKGDNSLVGNRIKPHGLEKIASSFAMSCVHPCSENTSKNVHQSFKNIPTSYLKNKNCPEKIERLVAVSGSLMRSLPCLEYPPRWPNFLDKTLCAMCLVVTEQQLLFLISILEGKVNTIFANKLALFGGWTEYGYLSMYIYQLHSLCS